MTGICKIPVFPQKEKKEKKKKLKKKKKKKGNNKPPYLLRRSPGRKKNLSEKAIKMCSTPAASAYVRNKANLLGLPPFSPPLGVESITHCGCNGAFGYLSQILNIAL